MIGVVPMFLSRVSRGGLLQPYLVGNVPDLVRFGKKLSYILYPLVSYIYLLQSISVKLIYQFLYLINGLDPLKKSSKKKETRTGKETVEMLQQASDRKKKTGK